MSDKITGFEIAGTPNDEVVKAVTSLEASWTMDGVSQITVELTDPKMKMFLGNYFQVRREVTYAGSMFEVAATEIAQGEGASPKIIIECRRKAVQLLKRDKKPGSVSGATATDYARQAATNVGLGFVGEPTTVKQSITKVTTGGAEESTWDVLTRAAGEAQFVVFESDNTLYYASHEFLIGKWANETFIYPSPRDAKFPLMQIPNCRRSDDDPFSADFRALVDRKNARQLRPGMTVTLQGMGEFDLRYLITEVTYKDGSGEPVSVSGRTPEKKKPTT